MTGKLIPIQEAIKRSKISALETDVVILYGLARAARARNLVEIGVGCGASTCALVRAAQENSGTLTSIDIDPACAKSCPSFPEWKFVCADSRDRDLPQKIQVNGIDFLFLDSSHVLEDTRAELDIWLPLVTSEGMAVFHDVASFPSSVRVPIIEYMQRSPANWRYYDIVETQCGLGVLCKSN